MASVHDRIKNDPRYKAWRRAVLDRDGARCTRCGSEDRPTADHIVALARGGAPFDIDNGATLCTPCNSSKGDRLTATNIPRGHYVSPKWN